jgi:four helix bundle protein
MIKEDDIQERLIQYAARIIAVCDTLPTTTAGEHLAGQLLRSGTTPALNYVEARIPGAPSESVHKLKIALTELKESEFWLRIIIASDILSLNMLAPLIGECHQLQRILIARIKTAGKPATRQPSTLDS